MIWNVIITFSKSRVHRLDAAPKNMSATRAACWLLLRQLGGRLMLRRSDDHVPMNQMALEADHEAMSIPLAGFVTAAVISIGLWSLIVWTLVNLAS
jgi:hypothetical protein